MASKKGEEIEVDLNSLVKKKKVFIVVAFALVALLFFQSGLDPSEFLSQANPLFSPLLLVGVAVGFLWLLKRRQK